MVAALVLLDPELALGTLLELLALDKGDELLVVFAGGGADLVLLAAHVLVPLDSAVEAVFLVALEALEPHLVLLLEEEHVAAVGSRTPGNRVAVLVRVGLKRVLLVLIEHVPGKDHAQVALARLLLAVVAGTADGESVGADVVLEGLDQAVLVEDVAAVQRLHCVFEEVDVADLAGNVLFLRWVFVLLVELLLHLARQLDILVLLLLQALLFLQLLRLVAVEDVLQLHGPVVPYLCGTGLE